MIAWLLGCAPAPGDADFLRLRGSVSADVAIDGDDTEAIVAWVTAVDGELCVEIDLPRFVPSLFAYEVEIDGPPALDGSPCVPWPADLDPPGPAAFGVLALVDPEPRAGWEVSADPTTLLGWFAGSGAPLTEVVRASGGRIAAVASRFALAVDGADPPGPFGASYCRFDGLIAGLTLYEDQGTACDGWSPVAPAGERTEYQGIDLVPPDAPSGAQEIR